ncbi:hypothetical protein CAPTEDRAFT_222202 [Capitella teleta]|uniref:Rhodanese domain-containing protein n=1 Tax=Capitella teleta TaxID=283909 RepID=R7U6K7_CAPTE|nr:hypothetical protein CAPTEDRAFT_222202 [Capitella teleta]|eukprot:ELU01771.1 hypothetical protein CAPTEDRAFT_222202 [Capitella teleta]
MMAKALVAKGSIIGEHLLLRSAATVKSRLFHARSCLAQVAVQPPSSPKYNLTKSPLLQYPAINCRSSNFFCSSCTEQKDEPEKTPRCTRKTDVSYEELCELMQSGDIMLVDVREPKELVAHGRIPNATNIPLGELNSALQLSPEKFQSLYGTELREEDGGSRIVFICRLGVRSLSAIAIAERMGYEGARHVPGGYEEWRARQTEN